jgi:hypothetical protein
LSHLTHEFTLSVRATVEKFDVPRYRFRTPGTVKCDQGEHRLADGQSSLMGVGDPRVPRARSMDSQKALETLSSR